MVWSLLYIKILILFFEVPENDGLKVYSADSYDFDTYKDQLYITFSDRLEIWNTSTMSLINSINIRPRIELLFGAYAIADGQEVLVNTYLDTCWYIYQLPDLRQIRETCIQDNLVYDIQANSKYYYFSFVKFKNARRVSLQIIDKKSFQIIKNLTLTTLNEYKVYEEVFLVYQSEGYNADVLKFDAVGNKLWEIRLSEDDYINIYSFYYPPFVFVSVLNTLYQLSDSTGKTLRKFSPSSIPIKSIFVYDNLVLLYLYNSRIMTLALNSMKLLGIEEIGDEMNPYGSLEIENNSLFYSDINILDTADVCRKTWKVVQTDFVNNFKNITEHRNTKTPSKKSSFKINHQKSPPSKRSINTAKYSQLWNKLQNFDGLLSQNSFFNPVFRSSHNGTSLFIYFSGAGGVETGTCEGNYLKIFNISSIQSFTNEKLRYSEEIIFHPFLNEYCCQDANDCNSYDRHQMILYSSLFDYASVLLEDEFSSYYIIHSGCMCYSSKMTSNVFMVQIQEMAYTYLEGTQDIQLIL